jgi:TRAP-type C4-dicarboxylate transport system substrate-binding protein
MKRIIPILLAVLVTGALDAADKPSRIKMATLVPKGTSYHEVLLKMGEQWRAAPGGGVALTLYTDGTMGGEADMVKRMRIGQIQAGMLSGAGLAQIESSVTGLQTMPLIYRTLDEVDFVREKIRPKLEKQFADKGFVALFWTDAGWVRYFSRKPVVFPDDMRRQKLFAWAGDTKSQEVMRGAKFNAVPLETHDILPGLQTGLIDAVPAPPFFALAGQFYSAAPHMLDLNWAPLCGALVITKEAWNAIPAATQQAMRAAAEVAGKDLRTQARKEMDEAVEVMVKKHGLQVHKPTPEAMAEWQKLAEAINPRIRGGLVPAEMFDEVVKLLEEYRAGKK